MINFIQQLHREWRNSRRPYSVVIVGLESGNTSPPLDFLRFKTYADAAVWVLNRELSRHPSTRMTEFAVVDLRLVELVEHH